jgi:hypothetical protein
MMAFDERANIDAWLERLISAQTTGQPQSRWLERSRFRLMFWRGFTMVNPYEKRWYVGTCHGMSSKARINSSSIFNPS